MLPKDPNKLKVKSDSHDSLNVSTISLIGFLIIAQILIGSVCIIGGCIAAIQYAGTTYAIYGIVAGLFNLTLAVITTACRKYLSK